MCRDRPAAVHALLIEHDAVAFAARAGDELDGDLGRGTRGRRVMAIRTSPVLGRRVGSLGRRRPAERFVEAIAGLHHLQRAVSQIEPEFYAGR